MRGSVSGHDEMIDFLAVLFGYTASGERTDVGPFARSAHRDTAEQMTIKLFGVPNDFARDLGLTRRVRPDAWS